MIKKHILLLITALFIFYQSGYSQDLYVFMKVYGIDGEYDFPGNTPDGNNSIELKNFEFNEYRSIDLQTSTAGKKAEAPDLEFEVSPMDKAIVGLYQKMMSSTKAADSIKIYVYALYEGNYKNVETIKLKNPRVAEISANGLNGNVTGITTAVKLKYEAVHKTGYNYNLGTFTPAGTPTTVILWNYTTNNVNY